MNASLCHQASIECFQRARSLGVKPAAFIVLQTLAAEDASREVHAYHLVGKTGHQVDSLYRILRTLESLGLINFCSSPGRGRRGAHGFPVILTSQGISLMTQAPVLSNPWKNSQL